MELAKASASRAAWSRSRRKVWRKAGASSSGWSAARTAAFRAFLFRNDTASRAWTRRLEPSLNLTSLRALGGTRLLLIFPALLVPPVLVRMPAFAVRRVEDADVALTARVFFSDVVPRLLFWDGATRRLAELLGVFICCRSPLPELFSHAETKYESIEEISLFDVNYLLSAGPNI